MPLDAFQVYYWTEEWQIGEQDAEEDIRQGRIKKVDSVEDLMDDLRN